MSSPDAAGDGARESSARRPAAKAAIVVTHGGLASGLVSALETVVGPQPNVFAVSNSGKSPATLQAELEALVAGLPAGTDVYVLSDVQGGSCATTSLRVARRVGARGVFYGTNLTLLLEFVLRQELPPEAFFQALVTKARDAVAGTPLEPCAGDVTPSVDGSDSHALTPGERGG